MAATMRDVAQAAGVSVKTVSNYFNGYRYMSAATRERVEAAVEQLGYQINVAARNLRSGRSRMIALVIPELDHPYYSLLAQQVIDAADEVGLSVLVETTGGRRDRELGALSGVHGQVIDGAIYEPIALRPADRGFLDAAMPLVMIGERVFDGLADHVLINDVAAARTAMEHLIASGRRRIAVIGTNDAAPPAGAALRRIGCAEALDAAGIPFDERLMLPVGPWHRAAGAEAIARLIDEGVEFDAVFGFNDALALGAQWLLAQRGIRVPEQVAVMGLDDTEDGRFAHPTLTTVSPGVRQIARTAVELLAARIADPTAAGGFQTVLADFDLMARESTRAAVAGA